MFGKCMPVNRLRRGVVSNHRVIAVKFLGPEACNSHFPLVTDGKFRIFSRKRKSIFQPPE